MSNMLLISILSFVSLMSHMFVQRNLFSPGVVHGIVWLLVSLGYVTFQGEFNAISPATLYALALGIGAFSVGLHVAARSNQMGSFRSDARTVRFPVPAMIVLVSAIGLGMMLSKVVESMAVGSFTSLVGGSSSWYSHLRGYVTTTLKGSFGIASYILNFSFAGTAYLILYYRGLHRTQWLWPSMALSLGFALLSTGRTFLLLLGCMILGSAIPTNGGRRVGSVWLLPVVVGLPLLLATWLSGRLDHVEGGTLLPRDASLQNALVLHAKLYFLSAVAAFDHLVNLGEPGTGGSNIFRTLLAVLRALGLPVEVPELIQPYVSIPFVTNTYTVFSPYYRDFGLYGVGFFMLLLGSLHGWIFRQLKSVIPIIMVANALLYYALIMQFFQDQYFSLMSQWIQILGWTYLFNKLQPLPSIAGQDRQ
ncbi:MAG: oligosaccharide repeat unit polymerase [Sulfuritalea sp.]|nr:oligosaccharide repeat unit polymerase [Sulfuritalea sp.]